MLVRPQLGDNIGAAARAMLNFGLTRMRLVAPRDGWPNARAGAVASGAGRVLDGAGLFENVASAVADCDYVLAATARPREMVKEVMTPERAMAVARTLDAAGKRVGILFGPERAGLENDDLVHANAIVTVPVNPDFPSINLAQCVLLVAYEWMRRGSEVAPATMVLARTAVASRAEIERLGDHYEEELEAAGFFHPPARAQGMKRNLRNLWGRLGLTRAEVEALHGMLRQLLRSRGDG